MTLHDDAHHNVVFWPVCAAAERAKLSQATDAVVAEGAYGRSCGQLHGRIIYYVWYIIMYMNISNII